MMDPSKATPASRKKESVCVRRPRPPAELEQSLLLAERTRVERSTRLTSIESAWMRSNDRPAWTLQPAPPPDPTLNDMGLVIAPDPNDFPGLAANELPNYSSIVRGFSRCFRPALFDELGMPDPYAAWPYEQTYWDTLFNRIQPSGFMVTVSKSVSPVCFGETGQTDGRSYIALFDCSFEDDALHEAGHVIMDSGILGGLPPVSYHFGTGRPGQVMDAQADLQRLFGHRENKIDLDGTAYGLVSEYAGMNQREDFAETLRHFVYYPEETWQKVARQQANGSTLLGDKMDYVGFLYHTLSFKDGGVVDSWLGYPI